MNMALDSTALRHRFLDYFRAHHHKLLPSSSVVARGDPTLLFTNAGMNQFKDHFLGRTPPPDLRIATCQACVRAGGKHNDLENVGHTKRHLTLFEMAGNFSFGAYFKREAIDFAWEVATQVFEFDPSRIYPTVFEKDDEAFRIWLSHVPKERIVRMGRAENFWTMGSTGPCGPCSELLYDRGPAFGSAQSPLHDQSGERFLEFWNLVFMQNNLQSDGTLIPLPRPMIDTGAGLERIAMLKMGVDSVFETDILRALIKGVEQISGKLYGFDESVDCAMRVIADHCRSIAFCIADGASPSNVEQGYVVRKLIRRAMRYGKSLGLQGAFLPKILPLVVKMMGSDYPRLIKAQGEIERIVASEQQSFLLAIEKGHRHYRAMKENALTEKRPLSGKEIFTLKDTHGLPFELISHLAQEDHLDLDECAFQQLDLAAKDLAKKSAKQMQKIAGGDSLEIWSEIFKEHGATPFLGYDALSIETSVLAISVQGAPRDELMPGIEAQIALKISPFYPESGGQIGDRGELIGQRGHFTVRDTQSIGQIIVHKGALKSGQLSVGESICARVDQELRRDISLNHTATHLLDWALGKVLNHSIEQAGSLVQSQRLRFDLKWPKAIANDEIAKVETLINEAIASNASIAIEQISLEQARKDPEIHQQFGDKYGAVVRLVTAGSSKSLCCGTHAKTCCEIGTFRIIKEQSVGCGIRRIEAITGRSAQIWSKQREHQLFEIAKRLQSSPDLALERLERLISDRDELRSEIEGLKSDKLKSLAKVLLKRSERVQIPRKDLCYHLVIERVDESDLRALGDQIAKEPALVILIQNRCERALVFLRLSPDLTKAGLRAETLFAHFQHVGFRGKGGLDLAQGAGPSDAIDRALSALKKAITT